MLAIVTMAWIVLGVPLHTVAPIDMAMMVMVDEVVVAGHINPA